MIVVLLSVGFCFAAKKPAKIIDSYWYDENKTVLEINNFDDFVEFQRLLLQKRVTFKDKEVHLKTDIIVFDTTDSDTWSQKIKPRDFNEKKHLFKLNVFFIAPYFRGKFDGNGYYIRGLYGRPLFIIIKNAVIQNLNISHSSFFPDMSYNIITSTSIALMSINSTIKDCNVSADVYSGGGGGGGLVNVTRGTTIKNCSFNGNIKGSKYTGGITGTARKSSTLDNNKAAGTIIGKARKTDGIAGKITPNSTAINNEDSSKIIEKSRFTFGFETGYSFGIGDYGISNVDNLIFSSGIMINRHFSLSLATELQMATVKNTNGIKYSYYDDEYYVLEKVIENEKGLPKDDILYNGSWIAMPIFVKPRFYLSEKTAISPYIDANIGIILCWDNYKYAVGKSPSYWGGYYHNTESEFYSSFYFNPSFGVQIRYFTVSLGLKWWGAKYQKLLPGEDGWNLENLIETYERGGIVKKPNGAISLKIGVDF